MPLARLTVGIWIGLFAGYAYADPPTKVCQAIADQANREGPKIAEQNIYDLSDALVAILPNSMQYLAPKPVKSADIRAVVGCYGGPECVVGGIEDFLPDNDTIWDNLLVDTRPLSKQVFIFTEHSGHDHGDGLVAVEQGSDGKWARTFESSDAGEDSGFRILLDGKRPYVTIPTGLAALVDIGGYHPKGTAELTLAVEDPSAARANRCMIEYSVTARLTASDQSELDQITPPGSIHDAIVHFLDPNLQTIARQMSFDEKQGSRVATDHSFVETDTPESELKQVDRLLNSPWSPGVLDDARRNVVRRVMADDWSQIEEQIKAEDWESRWFAVGVGGHAYLGLLQRFSGTFPTLGPHYFDESLVALFALEGDALRPIAAYELQDVFRFSKARSQPLADGMMP